MSTRPTMGTSATAGNTCLARHAVALAPLSPKMDVAPADGYRLAWRVTLIFGASAKGFRCLLTLQRTKNTSHDEIRLKQEKTEESITHLGVVERQMRLGDEPPDPCSASSERGRFEPAPCS